MIKNNLNSFDNEPCDITQVGPYSMLIHFSTLLSLILPFAGVIVACILWLYKRQESPLIYECGRHAINFQLSTFFYIFLCFGLTLSTFILNFPYFKIIIILNILIIIILYFYWFILTFIAGFKAAKGQAYRIPLTISFIKSIK